LSPGGALIPRILLAAVGAGVLALSARNVASERWPEESDAPVYWEAGQRLRDGGARLYAAPERGPSSFIYPPAFAALVAPLTALPKRLGRLAWELIGLASLPIAALVLMRGSAVGSGRRAGFLAWLAAASWGALWNNTLHQQVGGLVLMVVAIGLARAAGPGALWGGVCLGLATHLKVMPIVLVPLLALRRAWLALAGLALGLVLGVFLPFAVVLPQLGAPAAWDATLAMHERYVKEVAAPRIQAQDAAGLGEARVPNNSLAAVVRRLFRAREPLSFHTWERGPLLFALPIRTLRWIGLACAGALYVLALLVATRRRRDPLGLGAAGLALTAADLGNPLSWPHHLWTLGLVAAPLAAEDADRRPLLLAVLAVSLLAYVPLLVYLPPFQGRVPVGPSERLQAWGLPTL
jgi:hypothetical protein